jgi:hypothetical protein
MNTKFFVILITAVLACSLASADTDTAKGSGSAGVKGGRGRGRGQVKIRDDGAKNANTIRGACTLMESAFNPIPGPCVNALLIVNDLSGNEVLKVRTTPKGEFSFSADHNLSYKIVPASQYYELVSPAGPISGGRRIELRLRQRP